MKFRLKGKVYSPKDTQLNEKFTKLKANKLIKQQNK